MVDEIQSEESFLLVEEPTPSQAFLASAIESLKQGQLQADQACAALAAKAAGDSMDFDPMEEPTRTDLDAKLDEMTELMWSTCAPGLTAQRWQAQQPPCLLRHRLLRWRPTMLLPGPPAAAASGAEVGGSGATWTVTGCHNPYRLEGWDGVFPENAACAGDFDGGVGGALQPFPGRSLEPGAAEVIIETYTCPAETSPQVRADLVLHLECQAPRGGLWFKEPLCGGSACPHVPFLLWPLAGHDAEDLQMPSVQPKDIAGGHGTASDQNGGGRLGLGAESFGVRAQLGPLPGVGHSSRPHPGTGGPIEGGRSCGCGRVGREALASQDPSKSGDVLLRPGARLLEAPVAHRPPVSPRWGRAPGQGWRSPACFAGAAAWGDGFGVSCRQRLRPSLPVRRPGKSMNPSRSPRTSALPPEPLGATAGQEGVSPPAGPQSKGNGKEKHRETFQGIDKREISTMAQTLGHTHSEGYALLQGPLRETEVHRELRALTQLPRA